MKKLKINLLLLLTASLFFHHSFARENINSSGKISPHYKALAANCNDATSQIDLNINNVRARILGAGDMWWDLNDAAYEIPKVDPSLSLIHI